MHKINLLPVLISLTLLVLNPNVHAQNLVGNGSFEGFNPPPYPAIVYDNYPISGNYHTLKSPYVVFFHQWFSSHPLMGLGSLMGVPKNWWGYQYPRTGKAYVTNGGTGQVPVFPLQQPMRAGQCYRIRYFVSRGDFESCASDALDGYFSKDSIYGQLLMVDTAVPQFINPLGVIYDTLHWTEITGEYTANGTEQYFAVGNFFGVLRNNQRTKVCTDSILWNFNGADQYSFSLVTSSPTAIYYIDDVAIWECDTPGYPADAGTDKKICAGEKAELGNNIPRDQYFYIWSDRSWHGPRHTWDTLATTPKFNVSPTKTTTYYLWSIDFKFEHTYDSVTVFVEHCDIDLEIPNVFTPNGDGFNDYFMIRNPNQVSYTLDVFNRWGNLVFQGNQNYFWNGTFNGESAPAGVYFYVLTATTPDGTFTKEFHGSVTILR
jgi:gliding motility-associated-like protein